MKNTNKKSTNEQKRLFLLTFFEGEDKYEEKEVNGWWLVKHWDGNIKRWTVTLYSKESIDRFHRGQTKFVSNGGQMLNGAFQRALDLDEV